MKLHLAIGLLALAPTVTLAGAVPYGLSGLQSQQEAGRSAAAPRSFEHVAFGGFFTLYNFAIGQDVAPSVVDEAAFANEPDSPVAELFVEPDPAREPPARDRPDRPFIDDVQGSDTPPLVVVIDQGRTTDPTDVRPVSPVDANELPEPSSLLLAALALATLGFFSLPAASALRRQGSGAWRRVAQRG